MQYRAFLTLSRGFIDVCTGDKSTDGQKAQKKTAELPAAVIQSVVIAVAPFFVLWIDTTVTVPLRTSLKSRSRSFKLAFMPFM
jgi:hypothetical protein